MLVRAVQNPRRAPTQLEGEEKTFRPVRQTIVWFDDHSMVGYQFYHNWISLVMLNDPTTK